MRKEIKKSIFWGTSAGFSLLFLYFLILALTQSFSHAIEQFFDLWYLMLPLMVGFGIQVFLFSFLKPVQLKITFDTHQGGLDFDITKISYLLDDKNNKYIPSSWDGGSGGHHLSGTLVFPKITNNTKQMKLIIKDVYNIESRQFLWNLE